MTWRSLTENGNEARRGTRSYFPNGTLRRRTATRPSTGETRSYDYEYNPNQSLTKVTGSESGGRVTNLAYDKAEGQTVVNETWSGGKDTWFHYDANGNVKARYTDGHYASGNPEAYSGGKETIFVYDEIDRETSMAVTQNGFPSTRSTTTTYHPSGAIKMRRKPNGGQDEFYFADDSRRLRFVGKNKLGSTRRDQAYTYDTNGNRTKDERGTHVFNSRGQLIQWTRGSLSVASGTKVDYQLNGSGAITKKTDTRNGGSTIENTYLGDRLLKSVQTGLGTTTYEYDSLGGLITIDAPGKVTRYRYDPFERLIEGTPPGSTTESKFTYDGLDRRDTKTTGSTTRNFAYIGATEHLSTERSGTTTYSYDYDSAYDRQGQSTKPDASAGSYRAYTKDANGSVEGLEDKDGNLGSLVPGSPNNDRYQYDPYGELETSSGSLSTEANNNPFRFEGFYFEKAVEGYDMLARHYKPSIGRFLTQDRFEDSLRDFALRSDPLTHERYAFAGGNPVGNVEYDGHHRDHRNKKREGKRGPEGKCKDRQRSPRGCGAAPTIPEPRGKPRRGPRGNRGPAGGPDGPVRSGQGGSAGPQPPERRGVRGGRGYAPKRPPPTPQSPFLKKAFETHDWLLSHAGPLAPTWNFGKALLKDPREAVVNHAAEVLLGITTRGRAPAAVRSGLKQRLRGLVDRIFPGGSRKACSFSGRTLVLMADGSRKQIQDVRVGDLVWEPTRAPARGITGESRTSGCIRTA